MLSYTSEDEIRKYFDADEKACGNPHPFSSAVFIPMVTLTPTRGPCVIEPSSTVSSVPGRTGKPSLPNSQTTVHS